MLTQEDDVDAHALRRQGWSISAIARHLGHGRRTIRGYLTGERVAGQRADSTEDPLGAYVGYLRQRLADDPHVWATALFDETVALGYDRSYPTFTKGLRIHRLRPHCEPCSASKGRDHAVIAHPPGEEVQWDWVELPGPPAHWNAGPHAHLLVGALAASGKWRGLLAESEDQPHLIEALHAVSGRLGGLPKTWRFDRMATVASPNTGRVTATFAAVAKHYGVHVALCPPRHGNRKGTVEKANDSAAQRWWRTVADELTPAQAQASLDGFCARVGDARVRRRAGARTTVGALAALELEALAPLPPAFPATLTIERIVSAQALVAFRGNSYSVPPGLAGAAGPCPIGSAHRSSTSPPPARRCWPGTASNPTVPVSSCATAGTSRRCRPRCWPRSAPAHPARARSGAHRARPRSRRPSTSVPAAASTRVTATSWSTSRSGPHAARGRQVAP